MGGIDAVHHEQPVATPVIGDADWVPAYTGVCVDPHVAPSHALGVSFDDGAELLHRYVESRGDLTNRRPSRA